EQGFPGALMFMALIAWSLAAVIRIRSLGRAGTDHELATLGSATCAALIVVHVAGLATDYLMAEVQFWLYAVVVSVLQIHASQRAMAPAPSPRHALRAQT